MLFVYFVEQVGTLLPRKSVKDYLWNISIDMAQVSEIYNKIITLEGSCTKCTNKALQPTSVAQTAHNPASRSCNAKKIEFYRYQVKK